MPVFLCRWPNGDFSVVKAVNKEEAIELLDEIGNAEGCPVIAIKDFMVHFVLTDDGEFELEGYGETTGELIMKLGYPILEKAWREALDKSDEERSEIARRAVAIERERVIEEDMKEPKTVLGRDMKAMLDAPSRKIDRIVEQEAKETLKGFKGKGKTN